MKIADTPRPKLLAALAVLASGVALTLTSISLAILHQPDVADATPPSEVTAPPGVTARSHASSSGVSDDPLIDRVQRLALRAPEDPPSTPAHPEGVTIVGDSLLVASEDALALALPEAQMDARVGRQFSEGVRIVAAMREASELTDTVVVALGTNGYVSESNMNAMLLLLSDVSNVYLVNVRVPRDWERSVNDRLAEADDDHPSVTVLDWYSLTQDQPELIAGDGYHLSSDGELAFSQLIAFFASAE